MSKRPDKQPVGAPLGSQNGLPHGIVAFKNEIKRKDQTRTFVDRTQEHSGAECLRHAGRVDPGYGRRGEPVGGEASIDRDDRARQLYFHERDRRIFRVIHKVSVQGESAGRALGKPKSPKLIATLYGYRRSVTNNLAGEPYH